MRVTTQKVGIGRAKSAKFSAQIWINDRRLLMHIWRVFPVLVVTSVVLNVSFGRWLPRHNVRSRRYHKRLLTLLNGEFGSR